MHPEIELRIGGRRYTGPHVNLAAATFDIEEPLAQVVHRATHSEGPLDVGDTSIHMVAPTPGPGHDTLAMVPSSQSIRKRFAASARSLGLTSSVDAELADARARLAELSVPDVDLEAARRRVADASGEEERLRERVATLRGRLEAHRNFEQNTTEEPTKADEAAVTESNVETVTEPDIAAVTEPDVATIEETLRETTTTLAEVETERIAADQALSRAVEVAREARDVRERQLKLEDTVANREREARRELAETVYPNVRDALEHVPGSDPAMAGDSPSAFSGDRVSATLAAIRVADLSAPVVLTLPAGNRRFTDARTASKTLETPVIRIAGRN